MTNLSSTLLPDSSGVLDVEILKSFEKVKSEDGSDILIELIDLYLRSSSQRVLAIQKAAAEHDWKLLKREAHTLKGSSNTLGLCKIGRSCQDLEDSSCEPADGLDSLIRLLGLRLVEAASALTAERNRRLTQVMNNSLEQPRLP